MAALNTYHGNLAPYNILSETDLHKIMSAIFHLMREIGVKFDPDTRALDLFATAGCHVSPEGLVQFPTNLVKRSLESTGKGTQIWTRGGDDFIDLNIHTTAFSAGTTCINVIDPLTHERRPSTGKDLAVVTRIADALPNIDGVALPCKITDKPSAVGEIEEFALMASSTTKPLRYVSEHAEALETAIEIASVIRGGPECLREKPYFSFWVTPLPLYYVQHNIDQIFLAVENGIPLAVGTMSIGGASAPITVAGNLVNSLATEFAGIVLAQLISKGTFCMGASALAFIDPMTANIAGIAESSLAEAARGQISRHIGLPISSIMAGVCGSPEFGLDGASIVASSLLQAVIGRAAHYDCLGTIEMGLTYSPHSLLFCDEIVGFVKHVLKGINLNEEALALDVTKEVGPGGDFLAEMHTAKYCRTEIWQSKYFRSLSFEQWELEGKKSLIERIDEDLRSILKTHQPEPLPEGIRYEIESIVGEHGASLS